MVNMNQIKAGLGDYIEAVMLPRMDSKRKFVTGIAYILIAKSIPESPEVRRIISRKKQLICVNIAARPGAKIDKLLP